MLKLNEQRPEKQALVNSGMLDVVEIFSTIQGEGPWAGTPATFLRLAGCNLACSLCDTDYTSIRQNMSVEDILSRINHDLVVITGGEPFRQNIAPLVGALYKSPKIRVQIETNGTLFIESEIWNHIHWGPYDQRPCISIVCSPKTSHIHDKLKPFIHALKYVIEAGNVDESDGLPTSVLGAWIPPARPWSWFRGQVFVQPEDSQDPVQNKANLDECVRVCMKYGYRLSLQQHKIINLP